MMKNSRLKGWVSLSLIVMLLTGNVLSTTVQAARDKTAPTAPTNLRAVAVTDDAISLAWSAATDKVGVTGYNIYRNNVQIGSSPTTSYIAGGLTPATSYAFYVKARDAAGNLSKASPTLTVKTLATVTPPADAPRLVGYYTSWSAYNGYTPDKVPASQLTHLNYAFANIGSDLKIALGDASVDPANFTRLLALKQANPQLQTLISVGGWTWSGRFSDVALTDASRTAFANSCVDFIIRYGFDGVDIDWEYPVSGGLAGNVTRTADKQNFTLLLAKLRERLDIRGAADNRSYLLTIAGGCGPLFVMNTELGSLHQYLDFANIMTYDIHGSWDSRTDFHAPLYRDPASPQSQWSVADGVNLWLNAGVPAAKIVVGVPFYGYQYSGVTNANNGLYQTYSSVTTISYQNIVKNCLNAGGYTRYFNPAAQSPWLFNGSTFINYDDAQSIAAKAEYVLNQALGGAMVWEMSQDYNGELLNALAAGLN